MNALWPQTLVQDLGWTLIHFLWQGAALAALLWILLRVPGSPSRRYLAACFALILMVVAPMITFAWLARQHQSTVASAAAELAPSLTTNVETAVAGSPVKITVPFQTSSHPPTLSERLEGFLPWLVCGWLAGVLGFSARLGAGWLQVRKLGRVAAQPLGEPWETRVAELARHLGVNRSLRLLQSALVEVPTVIGWLRPAILIPASCLSGLTPQQLESIFAHELAHIRRHDYLVNVLQSVVETLLFYHPAVWWVSRRIREERENCCDDLAVKICGDRVAYARALATLEESRLAPTQCAVAAAGPPLLQRIRRLLGQSEDAGWPGWLFAGIITSLTVTVLVIGFRDGQARETNRPDTSITALIKDVQSLCDAGKLDEAEARLALVSGKDRENPAVLSCLMSIKNARAKVDSKKRQAIKQAAESALAKAFPIKPMVHLIVKIAETDEGFDPGRAFGPDWSPRSSHVPSSSVFLPEVPAIFNYQLTNSISESFSGILTDPQFRVALRALKQRGKTDILTPPDVTTESGREALIDTTEEVVLANAVSGAVKTSMSFGPKVDLMAEVSPDQQNIELTAIATISGLLDPPTAVLPRMRFSQISSKTTLGDGQTLLLCGLESRSPGKDAKWLLVFVTPVILYPDGSRVHPDGGKSAEKTPASSQAIAEVTQPIALAGSKASISGDKNAAPSGEKPGPGSNSSDAHQAIVSKLTRIHLDSVKFDRLPLSEVLKNLADQTRKLDPDGHGVNFVIAPDSAGAGSAVISVVPELVDIRLLDVLDVITKTSDKPLEYSIGADGVTFSFKNSEREPLITRVFHVDPNTLRQGLKTRGIILGNSSTNVVIETKAQAGVGSSGVNPNILFGGAGPTYVTRPLPAEEVSLQVREFFTSLGLDLSTNTGKALVWNDQKGELLVKATASDLDFIERTIQVMNLVPPLITRTYHVDPNTFRQRLEAQGIFLTNAAANPLSNSVSEQVRQFFINRGVDLSTNSGRRLVYNDRKGELLVKATVADLKLAEQTISVVCAPPQIRLNVQFVEIDRSNNATNRLDWLPTGAAASFTTNAARKFSDPPPFAASPAESPFDPAKLPRSPTNSIVTQFQGLLTGPQAQVVIQALQQREGVDVLATPNVVTESGHAAQITVTQAHTVVTALDSGRDTKGAVTNNYRTQNIQCGAVLDAIPRVVEDGSIEVSAAGTLTEFLGYDDPRAPAFKKEAASGPANAQFPLPLFRVRQVATKATANDGQTIVLGGFVGDSVATRTVSKVPVLGDLPLVGRLFKTTTVHQAKKDLIIFITPTILQPDGSRVHPEPAATAAAEPATK